MKVIDHVRRNGKAHHYRIASGIEWLMEHTNNEGLADLMGEVASFPGESDSKDVASRAMDLLKSHQKEMDPVKYAAIFTALNEALNELTS